MIVMSAVDETARRAARLLCLDHVDIEVLSCEWPDLLATGDRHWLVPLLAHRLQQIGVLERLPASTASYLRRQLSFEAGFELVVARELETVNREAERQGLDWLLMKGAALAYSHYPQPNLRPRLDTDLLVRPGQRELADRVLRQCGYTPVPALSSHIGIAAPYQRRTEPGLLHAIDLHWQVVNPVALADALTVEELFARAVPLSGLAGGKGPAPMHALLIVALHRVAHHEPTIDLLEQYDVYLLARGLREDEWRELMALCDRRGTSAFVASTLAISLDYFPWPPPAAVADWIARWRDEPLSERLAAFTRPGRRVIDLIAANLAATDGWRARLRVLCHELFPPAAYMRARFHATPWTLPWWYARRVIGGLPSALERGRFR